MKNYLDKSCYFVEADSFSMEALWIIYVDNPYPNKKPIKYEKCIQGFIRNVGNDTHVEFRFAKIYGKLVCFYYPISIKIDKDEVTKFLSPYLKVGHCTAKNFRQCISACKNF